jgi:hypothetical protein
MPARIEIRGTRDVTLAAKKLKAAGKGKLVPKMNRAMKLAAKPVQQEIQTEVKALDSRARGGGGQARRAYDVSRSRRTTERVRARAAARRGLRATVARATRIEASAGGRTARLRIRVNRNMLPPDQRKLPRHLNRGKWRHPVFGSDRWVEQTVKPGYFDRPTASGGPRIRTAAVGAVNDLLKELT